MTTLAPGWLAERLDPSAFPPFAANAFGVTVADLTGPDRTWPMVGYRKTAMAAAREIGWSYPSIARLFGRGDHTTAMHAVRCVGGDDELSRTARTLAEAFKNREGRLF